MTASQHYSPQQIASWGHIDESEGETREITSAGCSY